MNCGGFEKNELAITHPAHNFFNLSQMIELRFNSFYCLLISAKIRQTPKKKKKKMLVIFFFLFLVLMLDCLLSTS